MAELENACIIREHCLRKVFLLLSKNISLQNWDVILLEVEKIMKILSCTLQLEDFFPFVFFYIKRMTSRWRCLNFVIELIGIKNEQISNLLNILQANI